ncbi:MAG: phosphoadenylyl-sulfate reductase [Bryobacteraceae bacterium]|nr:phosphoadenylyl-sulfate reductase [Bryobacteraceae bacterium]
MQTVEEQLSAEGLIEWALQTWGSQFAVVTSFQAEGMVVLDMAVRRDPGVRVITLDTGRLPEETYAIVEAVRAKYGVRVEMVSPDRDEVERMVMRFGPNLFRETLAQRRLCCEVRKVRPLARKLAGIEAYAVGLRRGQGESRENIPKVADDRGRKKLSPLADWTREDVAEYTRRHGVPEHPLYARGYTSIGCGPCTRATQPGESERAGRWWWEQDGNSECGLHFTAEGRVERTVDVLLREILTD